MERGLPARAANPNRLHLKRHRLDTQARLTSQRRQGYLRSFVLCSMTVGNLRNKWDFTKKDLFILILVADRR
jgi:hypothetical protein